MNPFNKTDWGKWSPDATQEEKEHSTEGHKVKTPYKDGSTRNVLADGSVCTLGEVCTLCYPSGEYAERKNTGKVDLSLLPPAALEELAKVLEFGAKKYSRDGWKKGMLYSVCAASCLRHIFKMLKGEWLDEESGLPHAAHAVCNLAFILEYQAAKREDLNDL